MSTKLLLASSIAALFALTACGPDQTSSPPPPPAAGSAASAPATQAAPATAVPAAAPATKNAGIVFDSIPYQGEPDPQLYLGVPVYRDEYPTTFHTVSDGSLCTSTLVGPRVLITAAHCVETSLSIRLDVGDGAAKDEYYGSCTVHPKYASDSSADVALCLMDDPVPVKPFENIEGDLLWAKVGGKIRLVGYGCITAEMKKGNDGVLRQGETSIASLPSSATNYLSTSGGVALCPGDSGGPAFRPSGDTYDQRKMISVNSTVQALKVGEEEYVIDVEALKSNVSLLAASTIKKFLTDWAADNDNPQMCGISDDNTDCRQ